MVIVACFALNAFHPAIMFKEAMEGLGGVGSNFKFRKGKKGEKGESNVVTSESNSDGEVGKAGVV